MLQLQIVAAVALLAGKLEGAEVQQWPQLHPVDVCHMVHTLSPGMLLSFLAAPILCCPDLSAAG